MGLELTFRIALIESLILFAVLAIKLKKLVNMVVLLSLINMVLGAIFYVLYVPHLVVISPLVHISTVSIFFLVVSSLMVSKNWFDTTLNVEMRRLKRWEVVKSCYP